MNPGGMNLANYATKVIEQTQDSVPLHQFEEIVDTMTAHNLNYMGFSDLRVPPGFQQWFNRHRKRFSASFNTNPAEPAASTAIISGRHHAAIAATATKLEGRVTIHTYTTGKNGRPHGYRRVTMLAIYVPQKAKKKTP